MSPSSGAPLAPTHTSQLLEELVAQAPDGPVDLEWLLSNLDKRSFGLLLLLLGLLVIIPGVATIATPGMITRSPKSNRSRPKDRLSRLLRSHSRSTGPSGA